MPTKKVLIVKSLVFVTVLGLCIKTPLGVLATDVAPPITTSTKTPTLPDGSNGWYVSPVQFVLQATDLESGVKEMDYRVDQGIWQKTTFTGGLNLAPNPSFETMDSSWEGTFSYDNSQYAPGFANASAKIDAAGATWTAINHRSNFAVATPFANMSSQVSLKTQNVSGAASFKIYAVNQDISGQQTTVLIAQSSTLTGTNDWTPLALNFSVNQASAIGVYMEIGLTGPGTVWADAVSITNNPTATNVSFTVATDNANHLVEYYSVDNANNTELVHSVSFKQDQTPPGNWHDSGAFRGLLGSDHELYVYTNVEDPTSGLSTFTDKFQYKTNNHDEFGVYSNLLSCSSTWQSGQWKILFTPPFFPGVHSAYLLTQKTDFCNSNWKICKVVRFYSEDLAGNSAVKDLCINGPWIKTRGKGSVRSNSTIDMLSESNTANTDSLIEAQGNLINFFTSSKNWALTNTPTQTHNTYDTYFAEVQNKTNLNTSANLPTTTGTYYINGSYTLTNAKLPTTYGTATFDQIIFVNGDLTLSTNVSVANKSTALFIVKGNVNVDKTVDTLGVATLADGTFYTAYNVNEGESSKTLVLHGLYQANQFVFQRTLQGTNNSDTPSEDITYEPKYLLQLKPYMGKYSVKWLKTE